MPILDIFKQRHSIRNFTDKPIEDKKIQAVLEAAMTAPSAHNYRKWEFIIIKNKKTIEKLSKTKRYSEHLANAPVIVAVCSEDWRYWVEDASIVAEHIYLEATHQGLGTCWTQIRGSKTHQLTDAEKYVKNILKIPDDYRILCLMPLGYPQFVPASHNKKFEQTKIHQETWQKEAN